MFKSFFNQRYFVHRKKNLQIKFSKINRLRYCSYTKYYKNCTNRYLHYNKKKLHLKIYICHELHEDNTDRWHPFFSIK